jgi:TolB-like protein/Tfp pilus assembly protein PilF
MNWSSVERLFAAAVSTPPEHRETVLGSDPDEDVRAEVRRLLARHDELSTDVGDPDFLQAIVLELAAKLVEDSEAADPDVVGRFEIIRRLGRGGTGVVYLARDPTLNRLVALKVLSPYLGADSLAVRRFTEEARAASALDHQHIVGVYEIGRTADDRLFISMAYHEGETLRERIAHGPLPVAESVRIAADIAEGLAAAHTRGIVHRDIKPENILLTARGACIVDFGIAKVGQTVTRTGAILGTAAYMSPEQTRGIGVDHRSDIWSLGVVLYEMVTGVRPFRAEAGEALVYGIRHDVPTPPMQLRPEIHGTLDQLIRRCLEKEPAARFPSAEAVLASLRAPEPIRLRTTRFRTRRAGLALTGLLTVSAAMVFATSWRASPPDAAEPVRASLAVVPFSMTGPAGDREYLIEGLTRQVIETLSTVPGLRVSDAAAVATVAQPGVGVPAIAARLGTGAVLRGAMSVNGGQLTVTVRMLNAADGAEIWSETYQRPAVAAASIVHDIRRSAVPALGLGTDRQRTDRAATDLVAYDLYLRGRFAFARRTPEGREQAALLFNEAIARDAGFARAYLGLAEVYMSPQSGPPAEGFRRARVMLDKALALDSTLALAQRSAGWIAMWYDRDWPAAKRHLERALALDPNDVWSYHWYAAYLGAVGLRDSSLVITRQARALDPVSGNTGRHIGLHLLWQRRYDEALVALDESLRVDSTDMRTHLVRGRVLLALGRYDEAIRELRLAGIQYGAVEPQAMLAYTLARSGRKQEAHRILASLEARARASYARPMDLAVVHMGLGDTARALDWIERIPDDRGSLFFLITESVFDPVRDSPRFRRVIEQLGLDDTAS